MCDDNKENLKRIFFFLITDDQHAPFGPMISLEVQYFIFMKKKKKWYPCRVHGMSLQLQIP